MREMNRRCTRELAMKLLYQYSITGEMQADQAETSDLLMPEDGCKVNMEYIGKMTEAFPEKREEIDDIISRHSHSWKIERISKVDLAILRLALFEMLYMDDIPYKVSINEAVELAKKYSTDKSHKYVNGLLGGYLKASGG